MTARVFARAVAGLTALSLCCVTIEPSSAAFGGGDVRSLKLYHLHTGEHAEIVFKRNGVYDQAGLARLNVFLRDWRKNEPTKMDPHLFDLIWEVYRASGSSGEIDVVCGYRSPATNGMLRKRSSGVAKNSLHMQGKALDFFIPGVPLAKLRAIGLQMQLGGVGFYPTSGSPFVHLDTGSVRHWPAMTRDQLVKIFPNGRTLHVPSDGKPLPGYAEALALYKARKNTMTPVGTYTDDSTVVAAAGGSGRASASDDDSDDAIAAIAEGKGAPVQLASAAPQAPAAPAAKAKPVGVAVAAYATAVPPLPRLAPHPAATTVAVAAPAPRPPAPTVIAAADPVPTPAGNLAPDFDFGPPQDWSAPAVPVALANAMAARDQGRSARTSLPIAPTAVVATIDVSRPLRANAITTAVLRTGTQPEGDAPNVLAYAPAFGSEAQPTPAAVVAPRPAVRATTLGGVPLPTLNPRHATQVAAVAPAPAPVPRFVSRHIHMTAPDLVLTVLDTVGLRMWISPQSTRQKAFAVMTTPDFAQSATELLDKPMLAFSTGFGAYAYPDLRTDRFSGSLGQQPIMVDLAGGQQLASLR